MTGNDWSPAGGLARASVSLLLKSLILLPLWAGFIWLITPVANWISQYTATMFGLVGVIVAVAFLMIIPAGLIASTLSGRLNERAGFDGPIVAVLAGLFHWGIAFGGLLLAAQFRPAGSWVSMIAALSVGLIGTAVIVKKTWLDPD